MISHKSSFLDLRQKIGIVLIASPVLLWGVYGGFFHKRLAETQPLLFVAVDVLGWVILPATCLVFLYRSYGLTLHDYGLHRLTLNGTAGRTALAVIGFLSVVVVQELASYVWRPTDSSPSTIEVFSVVVGIKISAIYFLLTAAFVEEIFYRGLLGLVILDAESSTASRIFYVLIASLIFGFNHWDGGFYKVFVATYFGIVASLVYLKLGSLWPTILGHIAIDALHVLSFSNSSVP